VTVVAVGTPAPEFKLAREDGTDFTERALVIFDQQGVVRWSHQADSPGELPALKLLREGVNSVLDGDPAAA
jgi:hypothetical protein